MTGQSQEKTNFKTQWQDSHDERFYFRVNTPEEMERLGAAFSDVAIHSYQDKQNHFGADKPMLIALDSERVQGMGKSTFAKGMLETLGKDTQIKRGYRVGTGDVVHYETPMWSDMTIKNQDTAKEEQNQQIQIQSIDYIHGRNNEPSAEYPVPRRTLPGITICEHMDLKDLKTGEDNTLPFHLSFKKNKFLPNALSKIWPSDQRVVCLRTDTENASSPSFQEFLNSTEDLRL